MVACECDGQSVLGLWHGCDSGLATAAIQQDSLFVLVLPCQLNVVMFGDAGVAVLVLLLFRHDPLHPMLW